MFDKIYPVRTHTEYVPYDKTVNHQYATTSEQAKHLEDLQKQAWASVTDVMVEDIEENFISVAKAVRAKDYSSWKDRAFACFILNGKEFEVRVSVEDVEDDPNAVNRAIAEKIAAEITSQIFKEMRVV
jgi:hypothetical protein